jgi:hypothetical protein
VKEKKRKKKRKSKREREREGKGYLNKFISCYLQPDSEAHNHYQKNRYHPYCSSPHHPTLNENKK